jgi:hypothetical protein
MTKIAEGEQIMQNTNWKIGEERVAKPSNNVMNQLGKVYGENPLEAVFRELPSNSFSHGKASTVYISIDKKREHLIIYDDGIGCDKEKIELLGGLQEYANKQK